MTIELNITTAPQPMRSKPDERPKPELLIKKKAKESSSSSFSFEFGRGSQKVKALVAKRRIPATSTRTTTESFGKPEPGKGQNKQTKTTNAAVTSKKSVALKRKASLPSAPNRAAEEAGLENNTVSTKGQPIGENLLLNVCTTPVTALKAQPKPKLSHAERMKQKRTERHNNRRNLLNKTLTQEEILEGIRKFSHTRNTNQRPPDRLEDKNQKGKGSTAASEEAEGKVESKARKLNTLRVKRSEDSTISKIGLFKDHPQKIELGQRLVKPIRERVFTGTKVETLNLHPHAVKNLADLLSITELTTVQQKTIPKALEGKDLLVRSQTGSGKTLAYALPVVEKLQALRPKLTREAGIMAVIIVPTRELAIQTYELFLKLVKPFTWLVPGVLMGGEKRKAEKARLRKGINILVGTPGRLVDHLLHTESFKMDKAKFLVLDEADRLLEMGYERDVKQIVEAIDKQRNESAKAAQEPLVPLQRMLLSATLTPAVQRLAGLTLKEPLFIDNSDEDPPRTMSSEQSYNKESIEAATAHLLDTEDTTGVLTIPEHLQLSYVVVPPKLRLVTLSGLLASEFRSKGQLKSIIFMSTMEMVNFHHDLLNEQLTQKVLDEEDEQAAQEQSDNDDGDEPLLKGLRFFRLHGSMSQTERQGVFKGYREVKSGVLLATDVVGRGIDVPEVDLVVQYSPPQKTADFVHRVGRTARAGRSGRAILFLTPSEVQFVRYLENKRIRISQVDMDIYLKALNEADNEANSIQEAASNLQHKFQELVADDKEMHDKACKAFVSWTKFYTTFPKELKSIFNVKNAHMGHFAKSFGLKDQPTSFAKKHTAPKPAPPTNRLTYTERDPEKIKLERKVKKHGFATTVTGQVRNSNRPNQTNRLAKMIPSSRALTISEFDSGLPAVKRRKRN